MCLPGINWRGLARVRSQLVEWAIDLVIVFGIM